MVISDSIIHIIHISFHECIEYLKKQLIIMAFSEQLRIFLCVSESLC